MENKESRRSAIRFVRHYMNVSPRNLVAEYESVVADPDQEPFPSITMAMEERAPTLKEEIDNSIES